MVFAVGISVGLAGAGCKAKPSTKTPSGTLRLLLFATEERNLAKMQSYCVDQAVEACAQFLDAIAQMEQAGKASRFDSWNPSAGPVPAGDRSTAYADLFGVNGDLFMRVSVTLTRDPEKRERWKIHQMTWESKREN
jgi:hypothetical protein